MSLDGFLPEADECDEPLEETFPASDPTAPQEPKTPHSHRSEEAGAGAGGVQVADRTSVTATVKPWVKTSLAPGSKVVMEYYERAGLIPYLEELGFHLVGYGCTTCIGNSGPLPEEISNAVNEEDLAVVSVLSGNRNFEG